MGKNHNHVTHVNGNEREYSNKKWVQGLRQLFVDGPHLNKLNKANFISFSKAEKGVDVQNGFWTGSTSILDPKPNPRHNSTHDKR